MKSIIPLILTAMFVAACSESKNPPEEKKEDASVVVEEKRTVEVNVPVKMENSISTQANVKGVPPRPVTKGLYDFSECKAKYPVGSDDYKSCVKAKYPNVKFVD
ncbi:hypothetical protein [Fibrobacter sp.]|uniref:hypothetical protein n=1 Tax=Fibrobacter sp. TaxID=35828 RepID=UPI0026185F29|nr:hypothetical protein [Fibrobacter sp.]MDD5942725.1 hypothetical protein [Fibrobacter sp.]